MSGRQSDEIRPLPAPPNWNATKDNRTADDLDRRATLRSRLCNLYQSLCLPNFVNSILAIDGATEKVDKLRATIQSIEQELDNVPAIKIALLGPSRHGKSTLLNALAACSVLPMSDIKPCTASIVSLRRADEWGFEIHFVSKRRLERERERAVADARAYLSRLASKSVVGEEPDDPRYLHSTLQRFIRLFSIDENLSPIDLVEAIATADIPPNVERLLGQVARPRSNDVDQMQRTVEKYLSTKDIYWTIVDTCEIGGPFENWHPSLQLVDVPGTNDTDPQRTAITNSLQQKAKAVAICTSDSNLGNDIQSWLRNSSVLGDFLEATEHSRQHLFIIRTKFDAHHPEIDQSNIDEQNEEQEERLYREAIERHKEEQTEAYREMFRSIASPLLPIGSTPAEHRKRDEMLERINGIRVFFVSALAHEAFQGRLKATAKQKRRLSEHFNDDPVATGIPGLKQFANELAETYLAQFYYNDLERQLELEVDRLVQFFRQQWTMLEAELSGGSQAIADLVREIDSEILPWFRDKIRQGTAQFQQRADEPSAAITSRLTQTKDALGHRLEDREDKWRTYYWNSLQAAARKKGIHTTCHGEFIDINQDICSMFVDDLSLSWSSFRDNVIRSGAAHFVEEFFEQLQSRLDDAAARSDVPEATAGIDAIITNLSAISRSRRDQLRRQLDSCVRDVESIRKPAYELVQEMMIPTYRRVAGESGPGCQQRMRGLICHGARENVRNMWHEVSLIITTAVTDLKVRSSEFLTQFGEEAVSELRKAVRHLKEVGKVVRRDQLIQQMAHIRNAALLLWEAISAASKVEVLLPQPAPVLIRMKQVNGPTVELLPAPKLASAPNPDESVRAAGIASVNSDGPPTEVWRQKSSADSGNGSETTGQKTDYDASLSSQAVDDAQSTGSQHHKQDQPHGNGNQQGCRSVGIQSHARLVDSPVYLVQKAKAGRTAPDDELMEKILVALQLYHGKVTVAALSEHTQIPTFRLRGLLSAVQRILNVDGQAILGLCRNSDTIELNSTLLRQEFDLE